ncbi:MAG: TRAP transporter small permease subunit [Rhizobiales bacterium]|nr:TRAP transporter small permease subunit [Hyphomicrobiales bacterium]
MQAIGGVVRRVLDGLYLGAGVLAACFTIAILVIIVAQMVARWTGNVFPGATDYAGYCMAGASFLAFAYALDRGAHIRVSILLNAFGTRRWWLEIWCYGIAALVATFFARYAVKGTYLSWKLKDMSQGLDRTPTWIPQLAMAVGTVLLAIALWDHLVRLLVNGRVGVADGADDNRGRE